MTYDTELFSTPSAEAEAVRAQLRESLAAFCDTLPERLADLYQAYVREGERPRDTAARWDCDVQEVYKCTRELKQRLRSSDRVAGWFR